VRITRALAGDIALAAVLVVAGVLGTRIAASLNRWAVPVDVLGFALVVATAVVLAARRQWPLRSFAAVTVCTSVYLTLGYAYGPILVCFMIATYSVARHARPARSAPYSGIALILLVIHLFVRDTVLGLTGLIPVSAWVVVPFALGFTMRTRHEAAIRARAEAIRQSVDEERFRVAQEVHDVVGHGLAAIKMQADIALHLLAKKPDQAEVALSAISRTSSDALEELRATLAMVRRTGAGAERSPVPGLGRLEELRQRMAEAGVHVRLETSGDPPANLPVAVDLTGYRIVQESLTNVLRHSGSAEASVCIRYQSESVLIVIANPVVEASTGSTSEGGFGISGMRKRVLALGGEFIAARTPKGDFEVHARLPYGGRT
jgi:signal transduction histidine kinase